MSNTRATAALERPAFTPSPLSPHKLPCATVDALYVHVPFCFHKCHYCDFYSITRQSEDRMGNFVDLLLNEARQWVEARQLMIRPKTVFFGGGTPTLLPVDQMKRLLAGLQLIFDFSTVDEWTVEANPATVTREYCDVLKAGGVNRLSFGAQSFDPTELATLERHHNPIDVAVSVEMARSAGFTRLNVDLIYAIPGQEMASWQRSLETALALETPHLSCYGLTYEPNTPIAVRKRLGQFKATAEGLELEMMHYTRQRLKTAGRPPYEISNYASPSEECRHNLVYWTGGNYIGLGPSAASHVEGWRWRSKPHLGEWETAITAETLPAGDVETLSPPRRAGELAMLMLRLEGGINFAQFSQRTGLDARLFFREQIDRLAPHRLVEETATTIRLAPAGLNVADAIGAEFLASISD